MVFESGLRVGKYVLGTPLGRGGFGTVFVAHDTNLDRDVALKFLHPQHTHDPRILQRFLQEARATAKISHPGIVTIYETGTVADTRTHADGTVFIAMELLWGESLTRRLDRSRRFAPEAAMEVCRQIASALDSAHAQGIIHRDLKPDNIYLVPDPAVPGGERVKVLDFGIAKLAADAHESTAGQTSSMMVFGTPRYMSPEQCKSATKIDHRSDIYALGCILFELVCGQPPFEGEPGELVAKQQLVAPPTACEIVPETPAGLDQLISMLLAKNPDHRPQTMAIVERALALGGAAPAAATDTEPPSYSRPRPMDYPLLANPTTLSSATGVSREIRRRTTVSMITIGSIAVVAIVCGIWIAVHARSNEPDEPRPAATAPTQPVATLEDAPAAPPSRPPPLLTAEAITQRIGTVFAGDVKKCHDKRPTAHGTLELSLTVDAQGDVSEPTVNGVDPDIATCVEAAAATWTFIAEQGRAPIAAVWTTKLVAPVPGHPVKKPPPGKDKRPIGNGTIDPFPDKAPSGH